MLIQRRWVLILGLVLTLLAASGWLLKGRLAPVKAGIQVETTPVSTVYIDGQQAGTTPYEATRPPGEITLRLVPAANGGPLATWETKLSLTANINTVVRRDFAETDIRSSGEVLSFEKIAGNTASLTIVSSPDSAQIKLDGQIKGFTPIRIDAATVGEHEIVVSRPGYKDRTVNARVEPGHRLTAVVYLAQTEEKKEEEVETPKQTEVEILTTPTGFLRVREDPTTSATESARVTPGKRYPYIGENEGGTWFKIEYEEGKVGWISAQYAKKTQAN